MSPPTIIVLDGFTLNPGDISWEPLLRLGQVTIHERTAAHGVVPRLAGAEIALTNKVRLAAETLRQLPELRYVGLLATGTNAVDLMAARTQGIVVSNVPAYSTHSVVQLVFENLLDAATRAHDHREAVRIGRWEASPDFCFNVGTPQELAGKTLGIVGLGSIGSRVAEVATAFGMQVMALTSLRPDSASSDIASRVPRVPLPELLARSDFVTLHCPLTDRTRSLLGQAEFASMKPAAFLINTARGALIDELALARALDQERIAGAYLDVLIEEPPPLGHALLHHPRCKVTPHVGWTTREARERLLAVSIQNIEYFLQGMPANVVN